MANYTIPFKSLQNVDCVIDISDGSIATPIVLSVENSSAPGYPAANPVMWMDDNSDDLLNVVRVKTGYINLVEKTYGSLNELIPTTDTQYEVTVTYNSTVVFKGYMQAQAFENQYDAGPREISFPIMSPLGLLTGNKFNYVHQPQMITIGQALAWVCGRLGFSSVVLPENYGLLASEINSLVISPYSNKEVITVTSDMYAPITMHEFIEALCNCNGMIVYDMPDKLIFARYELNSGYIEYPYSQLTAANPTGTEITSYPSLSLYLCDDETTEGLVRPLSRINVSYDGEYVEESGYGFEKAIAAQSSPTYTGGDVMAYTMKLFLEQGTFEANHAWASISLDGNGLPTTKGVGLWAVGSSEKVNAGIMVYFDAAAWADSRLFTVKFFQPPINPIKVDVEMLWGDSVKTLGDNMEQAGFEELYFDLVISCRGYYYNGSSQSWTTSSYKNKITIGNDGKGSLIMWYNIGSQYGPIVVDVYQRGSEMPDKLFMFTNIKLSKYQLPYYKYIASDHLTEMTIDLSNQSSEEGSVSRLIAFETDNTNTIHTTQYSSIWNVPFYPYLGSSMRKYQFSGYGIFTGNIYLTEYTYSLMSGKVIAAGFMPAEDKTTVMLME